MPKVLHGNYQMSDCDADLQNAQARHPAGVVAQWPVIFDKALAIIFSKVKGYTRGQLNLNRSDLGSKFFATKKAPISKTGSPETEVAKNVSGMVPVEWKMRTSGGHNTTETAWELMIDLDDVPPGVTTRGPDRPHIGYLLTGKGHNKLRVDGHIFVEHVIASRSSPGEEETDAAKIYKQSLGSAVG